MISFNKKQQLGLTLVELMIAMVIGLVLVGGVIQIFVANNQTYRVTENMSRVQENGRFVLDNLGKIVRLAGFQGNTEAAPDNSFPSTTFTAPEPAVVFAARQVISGTDGGVSGGGALDPSDVLFVRFRGADKGAMTDCTGTSIGEGTAYSGVEVVNRYYLQNGSLTCFSSTNPVPQPLIDNVVSFQVLYGMTTDPRAVNDVLHDVQAECYISASVIGAGSDCTSLRFTKVTSIRIRLLLATPADNLVPDGVSQTVNFDDDGIADTMADNRLYREVTTTIALRNKIL